jgi:hypothetical protein
MSERLFDPIALLNQNMEANATKRTPNPVGETVAQITKMEVVEGKAGPNAKTPGAPWARLDLTMESTDPEYLALFPEPRDKAIIFHGIMLDMKDGSIATGPDKNVRLGKLREACGVNGKPLSALQGCFCRVQVGHKPHPNDASDVLAEVTAITAA